ITDAGSELDPLTIGAARQAGPGNPPLKFFDGAIDEVEYFNKALTPTEVTAMYHAGSRGKCKPGCDPRPSGMVSWWSGDGHASDIQGGNDGMLEGGTGFTAGPNDHVGRAFDFDGSTGYVRVPHSPDLEPGTGSFSVDAWVLTTSTT